MASAPSPEDLAEALPGLWRVRASNLVHWINAERLDPTIDFDVSASDPLSLTVTEHFSTPDGKSKSTVRTAVRVADGFVGWGTGIRRFSRTRWSLPWLSDDGVVALIVHNLSGERGDGYEVLIRDRESARDVRSTVTSAWEDIGLAPEGLARLTWFSS